MPKGSKKMKTWRLPDEMGFNNIPPEDKKYSLPKDLGFVDYEQLNAAKALHEIYRNSIQPKGHDSGLTSGTTINVRALGTNSFQQYPSMVTKNESYETFDVPVTLPRINIDSPPTMPHKISLSSMPSGNMQRLSKNPSFEDLASPMVQKQRLIRYKRSYFGGEETKISPPAPIQAPNYNQNNFININLVNTQTQSLINSTLELSNRANDNEPRTKEYVSKSEKRLGLKSRKIN